MRLTIVAVCLTLTLAGCNAGSSNAPKVAERYQEALQLAWEQAGRGEVPTNQCARVSGAAMGNVTAGNDNGIDAAKAYEACYVDVQSRWIKQRINQAEAGKSPCLPLMTGLMTARLSLGSFASEFGLTLEEMDAKLDHSTGAEVDKACPDQAGLILGRKS